MSEWRRAELEAIWFARIEEGLELLRKEPQRTWVDVADHFRCGTSTLREWRGRYWAAKRQAS